MVGLTAVAVSGFILIHVSGNMFLFVGPEAFNRYSYHLTSIPLVLYAAEVALLILFGVHFILTAWLTIDNLRARAGGPSRLPEKIKRATLASRTMIISGLLVLTFLVLHVLAFRFGPHYTVVYDGLEMRDLYRLVNESFKSPLFTGWYVFALVLLWFHLNHGVSSFFQSLGLSSSNAIAVRTLAYAFSVLIIGAFIAQALYLYLGGGN